MQCACNSLWLLAAGRCRCLCWTRFFVCWASAGLLRVALTATSAAGSRGSREGAQYDLELCLAIRLCDLPVEAGMDQLLACTLYHIMLRHTACLMRFKCCRALPMGALTDSSRICGSTHLLSKANGKAHCNMQGAEAHQSIGLGLGD